MSNQQLPIHIGGRVREVLKEQGRSAMWLARQLPCQRSTIYNIFTRDNISAQQLMDISRILNHDFFKELSVDTFKK